MELTAYCFHLQLSTSPSITQHHIQFMRDSEVESIIGNILKSGYTADKGSGFVYLGVQTSFRWEKKQWARQIFLPSRLFENFAQIGYWRCVSLISHGETTRGH